MAEAIRLRYPAGAMPTATSGVELLDVNETEGWLTDHSTWKSGLTEIASYDEFVGDKQKAGWLLNENVAFLFRAFSTYDRQASLAFDGDFSFLPPDFDLEAWVGSAYVPLALKIDLSAIPDWTKVEVFNYAEPLLTLTPGDAPVSLIKFEIPLPGEGIYGFSAVVTHSDSTISTTNPLMYGAIFPIPEPSSIWLLVLGITTLALPTSRDLKGHKSAPATC
jgi:hypothetical protein